MPSTTCVQAGSAAPRCFSATGMRGEERRASPAQAARRHRGDRMPELLPGAHRPLRLLAMLLALLLAALPAGAMEAGTALLEQALLHNVRGGYVDYDGLAASPQFAGFIGTLATATIPAGREEALAFYINAYNALAIQGVLDGRSTASAASRRRFFRSSRHELAGRRLTLADIEQQLRALDEPRVWFSLACTALSCPRLASHAYRAATLDAQLDAAVAGFIDDPSRNRFDIAQKIAFVSPLFEQHRTQLEAAAGSLPAWLAAHAGEPASRAALLEGWLELRFVDFDWELNGSYRGNGRRSR